jgi:hypothetical protein
MFLEASFLTSWSFQKFRKIFTFLTFFKFLKLMYKKILEQFLEFEKLQNEVNSVI